MKSYDEVVEIYEDTRTDVEGEVGSPDGTFVASLAGVLAELEIEAEDLVRKLIRLAIQKACQRQAAKDVKDPSRLGPPRPTVADLEEVLQDVGGLTVRFRDPEDRS